MKIIYIIKNTCLYLGFFMMSLTSLHFIWLVKKSDRAFKFFSPYLRFWTYLIVHFVGFYPKKTKAKTIKGPVIYVANHSSQIDIPLLYSKMDRPTNFIGKKELAKIPLFGLLYAAISVLVDRNNRKSIKESLEKADKKIKQGISIAIFPEGGVPKDSNTKLAPFKNGAFALAINNQIPIIPVAMPDNKRCFPYKINRPLGRIFGPLRLIFHDPIETKGMTVEKDLEELKEKVWHLIEKSL